MSTAYDKMTRAERRVAIAKDVIKHIKAQQLRVRSCYGYVVHEAGWDGINEVVERSKKASEAAEKLKSGCAVCARGAMMLCKVSKFNHYEFEHGWGIGSADTTNALKDAFSEQQLNEIEDAFELNGDYGSSWFREIPDASDRLLAIMQNIVDHNGTFKPQVAYEVIG